MPLTNLFQNLKLLIFMKNIVNILLAILVLTVVISLIIEPLTTANYFAGVTLMCIAGTSFFLLNKQKN